MPFDPTSFAQEILDTAATHGWESHFLNPVDSWQRPWFGRKSSQPNAPRLYISAGIHGDEPAGPNTALKLVGDAEFYQGLDIILFPLLNPSGLAADKRENAAGVDLNRDYRHPKTAEIHGHIEALSGLGKFDLTLCLHEDWEAMGVYLYELNLTGKPGIAGDLLTAMSRHVPIETSPLIDGFEACGGVISRNAIELRASRPDWAEALFLAGDFTDLGYTFETPSRAAALEARVAAQVAGAHVAADFLRRKA